MFKKVIAFIVITLMLFSLFAPLKVFADVNISDNDVNLINENQLLIGRKLATLDVLENLISNGVSSFTLDNVSDVDSYLDSLWTDIDNAYNDGNLGIEIIGNVLDWNGLSKLHYEIEKNTLAYATQFNTLGISLIGIDLLADYFENNDFVSKKQNIPVALTGLEFLSALNQNTPEINPDSDYLSYIDKMNTNQAYGFFWADAPYVNQFGGKRDGYNQYFTTNQPFYKYSWFSLSNSTISSYITYTNNGWSLSSNVAHSTDIKNLIITTISENEYSGRIDNIVLEPFHTDHNKDYYGNQISSNNNTFSYLLYDKVGPSPNLTTMNYSSSTLANVFDYYSKKVRNVNIFVDGVPWSIVSDVISYPTIDIDGMLKLENSPAEYEFPDDIKIDYKKLYEVILNAIQNGLPVTMDTITNNNTYIDNNDNSYSPIIYNYYNDDSEDEKDYIDTLISSATVPNFNQTYLIPLTEPLDNGLHTLYASVSVIPEDIMIIFGGLFVLLLFVAILNRMLE